MTSPGEPPSDGLSTLLRTKARQKLVHYFLTTPVDPDGENQSVISEGSGASRNSVGRHIDVLVGFGLVEEMGDGPIKRYAPNRDSDAYRVLKEANEVLSRIQEDNNQ